MMLHSSSDNTACHAEHTIESIALSKKKLITAYAVALGTPRLSVRISDVLGMAA